MKKLLALLFALSAVASVSVAQASQVTYVFTGVGDGVVGNGFIAETYRFTVTADSSTVQNGSPPFSNVLNGGTISITNTPCAAGCTITAPSNYLVFNDASPSRVHGISVVGNLDALGFTLIEGCWACGGSLNDNLVTNVPPTPSGAQGALEPYAVFATSGGPVQIRNLDGPITYSVTTSATVSPVPSLSQAGLILLAGLLGLATVIALRRRS